MQKNSLQSFPSVANNAINSLIDGDYMEIDTVETLPLQSAYAFTGKFPGFHCGYLGDSTRSWLFDKNTCTGLFWGSIVKLTDYSVDISFDRVSGEYTNSPTFSIWTEFGREKYTQPLSTGTLVQAGGVHNEGKAMCIDSIARLFFLPRGYSLYFDGPVNGEVIDYGLYFISKSISATYGGSYANYLSPVGPIVKWDQAFRYGYLTSGDLLCASGNGSNANFYTSWTPVRVDLSTGFVHVGAQMSPQWGAGVVSAPQLFSAVMPCVSLLEGLTFANGSWTFSGKIYVPSSGGDSVVPYAALNAL